jgi:hypothetical protein
MAPVPVTAPQAVRPAHGSVAVAHAPARNLAAEFHDLAGAVREHHQVPFFLPRSVAAVDHHKVAEVERGRAQTHEHVARAGLGLRPLHDPDVVEDGDLHVTGSLALMQNSFF